MNGTNWRSAVALSCGIAVVLVVVIWNTRSKKKGSPKKGKTETKTSKVSNETNNYSEKKVEVRKKQEKEIKRESKENSDFPELKWVKVGRVEELYYYPLKSGRGKAVGECKFTEYGISVENDKLMPLRDRMFLVYNEETRRFQTGREYPTMILVSLSAVDEHNVKLEAVGMPSVVFRVPEKTEKSSIVECTMWFGESVKSIDCGPEPAEWLSRFLTGTNSGLRLGFALTDKRPVNKGPWERFTKVYKNLQDGDLGLFSDLTSYMMMSSQSLEKLNEQLESPVPALQFRPNIVVSAEGPFAEDNWEWIKIGNRAIIRNVKPCSRCRMVKVNPETGTPDKEEPLKTLKSFREQKDPKKVSVDGSSPTLGVYCGLYITGRVKVGDEVFVHAPDDIDDNELTDEDTSTKSR